MSYLVTCPDCKTQMANQVRRCPQCGRRTGAGPGPGTIALAVFCIAAAVAIAVVWLR